MEIDAANSHFTEAGMALAMSQIFERAFVMFAKLAAKHAGVDEISDVTPMSLKAFKQPINAILNEMNGAARLSAEFLDSVGKLVEARHTLVHRATTEFDWPNFKSQEAANRFAELCRYVIEESERLAAVCGTYIGQWAMRFPEMRESIGALHEQFGITDEQISAARRSVEGT